jgi:arylsulfatase A-like enzyme
MSQITRRRLLQGSGAVLAGLALGACSGEPTRPGASTTTTSGSPPPTDSSRPNIIVFLADDLGFSDLGCYGSEISTPNLDRLAATGRRFSNMHNNPRCCPSRATLLTGLYPTQAGVGDMTSNQGTPAYQGYLNDSCVTIAQALGQVGYRSAVSGKWHVAPRNRLDNWPAMRGFERSFCQMGGGDYYRPILYEDGKVVGTPTDPNYYLTTAITDHAVESVRTFAQGTDPFFMYVAYKNPHFPLQAPAAAIEKYHGAYDMGWTELRQQRWERTKDAKIINPAWSLPKADVQAVPWASAGQKDWQAARMEVYAAQVSLMDEGIGEILDTVEQLGIRDNTLILFLSDNGACAEIPKDGGKKKIPTSDGLPMQAGNIPGLFPGPSNTYQSYGVDWANASNSPFRKYKRWTEEGGISTPLIASWPAALPAGGVDDRFLHIIDLMPRPSVATP